MPQPETPRGLRATLLRWRAAIVLVPLLAGLGYAGLLGARMLFEDPTPAAAPAPEVTCWDGTVDVATACSAPTGKAGLRWVFPSFDPQAQRCREVVYRKAGEAGPLEFSCRTRVQGTTARISYSERSSLQSGLEYFAKLYGGVTATPAAGGTQLVYRDPAPTGKGTYRATIAYTASPFAVTVTARNERLRDAVLDDAVRLRPERYLSVRPTQSAEESDAAGS